MCAELLRSWRRALDSANQAIHSAQEIGLFNLTEVAELELGIQAERAWLRSRLGDVGSIRRFP